MLHLQGTKSLPMLVELVAWAFSLAAAGFFPALFTMEIIIFQIINYTLSFAMWMILGRFILTLIIGNRHNIMLAAFIKITEPIYRVTRMILPFKRESCVPFLSILIIIILRLMLIIFFNPGTQPK